MSNHRDFYFTVKYVECAKSWVLVLDRSNTQAARAGRAKSENNREARAVRL